MIPLSDLVEVGSFTKPHGLRGEMSAIFDSEEAIGAVEDARHLFVELDGLMVPFSILSYRPKGTETLLLTLKGIDTQDFASKLTNKPVYLEASLLPETAGEDGSFYLEDLVGFTIFTEDGPVGEITGYDDSTDNLLFDVRDKNGYEVLVPAVGDMITEIDEDARTVTMDLPGGLFSL